MDSQYPIKPIDFGGVSTANIELENIGFGPFGDMSEAFGTGSPEWTEAVASNAAPSGTAARAKAFTDKEALDVAVEIAADAVEAILKEGPEAAMNRVNTRPE